MLEAELQLAPIHRNASSLDSNSMAQAAALQAMKMFTGQSSSNGQAGQNQVVSPDASLLSLGARLVRAHIHLALAAARHGHRRGSKAFLQGETLISGSDSISC